MRLIEKEKGKFQQKETLSFLTFCGFAFVRICDLIKSRVQE